MNSCSVFSFSHNRCKLSRQLYQFRAAAQGREFLDRNVDLENVEIVQARRTTGPAVELVAPGPLNWQVAGVLPIYNCNH
jgi:hypothetical protein